MPAIGANNFPDPQAGTLLSITLPRIGFLATKRHHEPMGIGNRFLVWVTGGKTPGE
jgi:hypothetical protein